MFHLLVSTLLAVAGAPAAAPQAPPPPAPVQPPATVIPFRTEAQPRIDPVFGDAGALRNTVDRFLTLQGEMERVHDDFSNAVHETLGALGVTSDLPAAAARSCPVATGAPYARALSAGGRYLALGQQLQAKYRDIRRADDLGDSVALTPDYRVKIKKARELHQQLLTDYREMRVAFYDQLSAEMRHAGCKLGSKIGGPSPADGAGSAGGQPNPSDPAAWLLDEQPAEDAKAAPPDAKAPAAPAPPAPVAAAPLGAPAIWIDIDNTLCNQPTHVSIDGQAMGDVAPRRKTSVRTHAGPREICALPAGDSRACGDAGTVRKAYLHEGWALTVHCVGAGPAPAAAQEQ
jgi:hypothetical protein